MAITTRQKALLCILDAWGGACSKIQLVKLAFLLRYDVPSSDPPPPWGYDFVPYDYGPFSFQLYRDLTGIAELVDEADKLISMRKESAGAIKDAILTLPPIARRAVASLRKKYGAFAQSTLVDTIYARFPWYASRSKLRPHDPVPDAGDRAVYTMGYEGLSVDSFVGELLSANISTLADIRRNPLSRKYGFSKTTLQGICDKLHIRYCHIPALGIPSSDRRTLETKADYDRLFKMYEVDILPSATAELAALSQQVQESRTALVCFEEDPQSCHRSRTATRIARITGLPIVNLKASCRSSSEC